MHIRRLLSFALLFLSFNSINFIQAQNWPCWRGPAGDGTSTETKLPTQWDGTTNVLWKSPLPGIGYSSPVVWEDKLFTLTALPETQEKILLCYNSQNGQLLWQQTVVKGQFEAKHNDNSHASGTPATDGKLIYLALLDGQEVIVAAYDFTGKQIWLQRPGTFSSPHGFSCSPVLYKEKVIVNCASQGDSFVAALSRTDGKTLWKVMHKKPSHSFSTPIFREMGGKMQMILGGSKEISSYNPEDGSRYWFVNGPSEDFCSTPVYNEKSGLVLLSSAWPVRNLVAIKPDGQGDVTATHVVWQSTKGAFYVPSPVCTEEYLFSTMTNGQVHCIEAATGTIKWIEPLGKQYASPVLANGLVYMPNDEGVITVIEAGPEFKPIAKNSIGEKMFASPAISNGKIYLRGVQNLYCIGNK